MTSERKLEKLLYGKDSNRNAISLQLFRDSAYSSGLINQLQKLNRKKFLMQDQSNLFAKSMN